MTSGAAPTGLGGTEFPHPFQRFERTAFREGGQLTNTREFKEHVAELQSQSSKLPGRQLFRTAVYFFN
jgi:hypothetical protein